MGAGGGGVEPTEYQNIQFSIFKEFVYKVFNFLCPLSLFLQDVTA